jgi:hypothetical protein
MRRIPHISKRKTVYLCIIALTALILFGCKTGEPTFQNKGVVAPPASEKATARQTAFRVRTDFEAPLNADRGWASELNEPATVLADEPFRLRFEVEAPGHPDIGSRFQLQVRRNAGSWEPLLAENFPQPAKKYLLDFGARPAAPLDAYWRFLEGGADALSWATDRRDTYLQFSPGESACFALARVPINWTPVEFEAALRFPLTGDATLGFVFGYEDPENYLRADLKADEGFELHRVRDGTIASISAHPFAVKRGEWVELKLIMEASALTLEYDDEAFVSTEDLGTTIPLSIPGIFVPRGNRVDLQSLAIEGEPRSPRTSIIASSSFSHGDPTSDLLRASTRPFTGGSGVSFADTTPAWLDNSGHSEWVFPLVIRRFSDEAALNEPGDRFDYRLVDAAGRPLAATALASVILDVAPGHLGGTFVETPMRLGPWQAENGHLYFLMEPSETWNALMTVQSTDGGASWQEVDGPNRPKTGDLEGFGSILVDDQIHMVHQTSDDVWYHVFRTSDHSVKPDSWAIRDERIASPEEPPTQVADIAVRSDGSVVVVYGGPHKIHFAVRSPTGQWSEPTIIDAEQSPDLSGPALILGRDDGVHLAYTGSDGSAWYRQLLPDNTLSNRTRFAENLGTGSEAIGSILPLVYLPESDTVAILYRLANGQLWERRVAGNGRDWSQPVLVSEQAVAQNTVDSDQTGADVIAHAGAVHCLFIDAQSQQLFHTMRASGAETWTKPRRLGDEQPVQWVRGNVVTKGDGSMVYGYVIDAGAFGGSGKNQYRELQLGSQ